MIKKLFGQTEEEQFYYLKPRLIILGVGVVLVLIGIMLSKLGISFGEVIGTIGMIGCVITLLVFGWAVIKGFFGIVSAGALLSNNVVVGIVIFVVFLMVGYFLGFLVAFIGLCRFFVLLKKRKGNN